MMRRRITTWSVIPRGNDPRRGNKQRHMRATIRGVTSGHTDDLHDMPTMFAAGTTKKASQQLRDARQT